MTIVRDCDPWPAPRNVRYAPGLIDWTCPTCGATYPTSSPPYRPHLKHCPRRGYRVVIRNLVEMYWKLARGHGCASYIRAQEWDRLRALRKGFR